MGVCAAPGAPPVDLHRLLLVDPFRLLRHNPLVGLAHRQRLGIVVIVVVRRRAEALIPSLLLAAEEAADEVGVGGGHAR